MIEIGRLKIKSPLVIAACPFPYSATIDWSGIGAVTSKGVSLEPVDSEATDELTFTMYGDGGYLRTLDFSNPGIVDFLSDVAPQVEKKSALIINIFGNLPKQYDRLASLAARSPHVAAIEVNIGQLSKMKVAERWRLHYVTSILRTVKKQLKHKPILVKVPICQDIFKVAQLAHDFGYDGMTLLGSFTGLGVDFTEQEFLLGGRPTSFSSPGLRPLVLDTLRSLKDDLPDFPVIATGGVRYYSDFFEYILTGASAVGVATLPLTDMDGFNQLIDDVSRWRDMWETRVGVKRIRLADQFPPEVVSRLFSRFVR